MVYYLPKCERNWPTKIGFQLLDTKFAVFCVTSRLCYEEGWWVQNLSFKWIPSQQTFKTPFIKLQDVTVIPDYIKWRGDICKYTRVFFPSVTEKDVPAYQEINLVRCQEKERKNCNDF